MGTDPYASASRYPPSPGGQATHPARPEQPAASGTPTWTPHPNQESSARFTPKAEADPYARPASNGGSPLGSSGYDPGYGSGAGYASGSASHNGASYNGGGRHSGGYGTMAGDYPATTGYATEAYGSPGGAGGTAGYPAPATGGYMTTGSYPTGGYSAEGYATGSYQSPGPGAGGTGSGQVNGNAPVNGAQVYGAPIYGPPANPTAGNPPAADDGYGYGTPPAGYENGYGDRGTGRY